MKSVKYRLLAMIVFILVIGALGLLVRRYGSLDWFVENEIRLKEIVEEQPRKSWFVGLIIYTAFSLVPGTSGKSVIFGWIFGFWQAVLMVDIGLTIAAVAGFASARYIARDTVNAKFGKIVDKLDRGLAKDGAFYLLMMRLAHLPFSFINYAAGATSVPLSTFCWTTAVGILPGTMIFVFVGTRIPTLASISENGVGEIFDPLIVALMVSTIVFPLLIRWAIYLFRKHFGSSADIELTELEEIDT